MKVSDIGSASHKSLNLFISFIGSPITDRNETANEERNGQKWEEKSFK